MLKQVGAKYVVFHVSEVTLRESYIYKYRYTDKEVIDASLEVINTLLDEKEYPIRLSCRESLVERSYLEKCPPYPPLIEGMHTQKKGIMLDTGHYMNTTTQLKTPEDAVAYLNK